MTESTDNVFAIHWTLVHPAVRYNIDVSLRRRARTAVQSRNAGLGEQQSELEPIADTELAEYLSEVSLDGPLADVELARDLFIGAAASNKRSDLMLAQR